MKKIKSKLEYVLSEPFGNKINILKLQLDKILTILWYSMFFDSIGKGSIIKKPLFLAGVDKVSLGDKVFIRDGARIESVNGGKISIGHNVSIEQHFHITCAGAIGIGDNTTISFNAMITDIDHDYTEIDIHILKQSYIISKTSIGANCFIGSGVKIMAGTILGKQCIVGANSVVKGAFPDYCVIVGIPGKVVKRYNTEIKKWEKTLPNGEFYIN